MKASEALLLGSAATKQGVGTFSLRDPDAPCALGTLGVVTGLLYQTTTDGELLDALKRRFPVLNRSAQCPVPNSHFCRHSMSGCTVIHNIWHLNDWHGWTRPQIAEWLKQYETEVKLEPLPQEKALVVV